MIEEKQKLDNFNVNTEISNLSNNDFYNYVKKYVGEMTSVHTNTKYINPYSYSQLGPFEKRFIGLLGEMMEIFQDGDKVDIGVAYKVFYKLFEHKNDYERDYIYGIFFPGNFIIVNL